MVFEALKQRFIFVTCLLFASLPSHALAEDFLSKVISYPAYKASSPEVAARVDAFDAIVQKASPPEHRPNAKPILISVIYPGNQASDYWRRNVKSLEARLIQAGVNYRLDTLFTESASEVREQEAYIQKELKKRPDYMVFTFDAQRHKSIIERILGLQQTKLLLQNITTPLRSWQDIRPFMYLGFDHELGSRMLAEQYVKMAEGGKGNYAVFFGPPGYVSQMRGLTFISSISSKSNLHLTHSYYVGFDRKRAKLAALRMLDKDKDLDFIYACSTDIALGIIDALKEKNLLGKIKVNGWGGGSAELEKLAAGELEFTVMRMNDDSGVAMADAIILDQNGQDEAIPAVYSGSMRIVTRENTKSEIADLRKQAFRYSD